MSVLFLSFIILLAIGIPMAFSLGLSAFAFSWSQGGHTLLAIPLQMFASVDQFVFMAIPLFMLSGELMVTTGIMDRLLNFAMVFLGRFRGRARGKRCPQRAKTPRSAPKARLT